MYQFFPAMNRSCSQSSSATGNISARQDSTISLRTWCTPTFPGHLVLQDVLKEHRGPVVGIPLLSFQVTSRAIASLIEGYYEHSSFVDRFGSINTSDSKEIVVRCAEYPHCAMKSSGNGRLLILLQSAEGINLEEVQLMTTWRSLMNGKYCHQVRRLRVLESMPEFSVGPGRNVSVQQYVGEGEELFSRLLQCGKAFNAEMLNHYDFYDGEGNSSVPDLIGGEPPL